MRQIQLLERDAIDSHRQKTQHKLQLQIYVHELLFNETTPQLLQENIVEILYQKH